MDTVDTSRESVGQAPRRLRWRLVTALLAGAFLVGIVLVILWQVVIHPPAPMEQYSPPQPPAPLPAAYYETVEGQIAQGLGESVAQVKAGIAADPGEGLFGVATTQGVSPDDLYTIEIMALQAASDQMAATGQWTPAQDDATMRYWRARGAKALGSDMNDWFVHR